MKTNETTLGFTEEQWKMAGETIVMLTARVYDAVYPKMREPDCTQLAVEIRDAAYGFEKKWLKWQADGEEHDYLEEVDKSADQLIKELEDYYC